MGELSMPGVVYKVVRVMPDGTFRSLVLDSRWYPGLSKFEREYKVGEEAKHLAFAFRTESSAREYAQARTRLCETVVFQCICNGVKLVANILDLNQGTPRHFQYYERKFQADGGAYNHLTRDQLDKGIITLKGLPLRTPPHYTVMCEGLCMVVEVARFEREDPVVRVRVSPEKLRTFRKKGWVSLRRSEARLLSIRLGRECALWSEGLELAGVCRWGNEPGDEPERVVSKDYHVSLPKRYQKEG